MIQNIKTNAARYVAIVIVCLTTNGCIAPRAPMAYAPNPQTGLLLIRTGLMQGHHTFAEVDLSESKFASIGINFNMDAFFTPIFHETRRLKKPQHGPHQEYFAVEMPLGDYAYVSAGGSASTIYTPGACFSKSTRVVHIRAGVLQFLDMAQPVNEIQIRDGEQIVISYPPTKGKELQTEVLNVLRANPDIRGKITWVQTPAKIEFNLGENDQGKRNSKCVRHRNFKILERNSGT